MERKVKYDYAFKLECLDLVLKYHYSSECVSRQKGPHESNIRRWVLLYKTYGKVGLLSRKNQSYSVDFKLKIIQNLQNELLTLSETSLKFNIPDAAIILKWK